MGVENIGAVPTAGVNGSRRAGVTQEDFLKVLLAQLTFQDPLKPLDNNEFIAQFAQLTNLEQTQQLNDKLDSLLTLQSGDQAVGLLGKTVEARLETEIITGRVSTVTFKNGVPNLVVTRISDGQYFTDITLGQISVIR